MEFTKYPSITNYTAGVATKLRKLDNAGEFVATEKIHGANFSFVTDGKEVRMASRNQLLTDKDQFHDHGALTARWRDAILTLARTLQQPLLCVYGEIFGGIYPHRDVPTSSVRHVQKGVFYAPDLHVRFYDMAVNGVFLDFDVTVAHFKAVGLPLVPILCRGTLDDCLTIDVEQLDTRLPGELHLPALVNMQNLAEGLVIRPTRECLFGNGTRTLVKRKARRFCEVHRDVSKQADALLPPDTDWSGVALAYVTQNRLNSVRSKYTTVGTMEELFMLIKPAFVVDVMNDLSKDHPEFMAIANKKKRIVIDALNAACTEMLKQCAL